MCVPRLGPGSLAQWRAFEIETKANSSELRNAASTAHILLLLGPISPASAAASLSFGSIAFRLSTSSAVSTFVRAAATTTAAASAASSAPPASSAASAACPASRRPLDNNPNLSVDLQRTSGRVASVLRRWVDTFASSALSMRLDSPLSCSSASLPAFQVLILGQLQLLGSLLYDPISSLCDSHSGKH